MHLVCLGLNHRSASLQVREAFAVARDEVDSFLQNLCASPWISEAFVISTCNRIEVYAVGEGATSAGAAVTAVRESLLAWHKRADALGGKRQGNPRTSYEVFDETIGAYHYVGREDIGIRPIAHIALRDLAEVGDVYPYGVTLPALARKFFNF